MAAVVPAAMSDALPSLQEHCPGVGHAMYMWPWLSKPSSSSQSARDRLGACLELRLGLKSSCSWLLSQPWAFQAGTCMVAASVAAWSSELQQLQLPGQLCVARTTHVLQSLQVSQPVKAQQLHCLACRPAHSIQDDGLWCADVLSCACCPVGCCCGC